MSLEITRNTKSKSKTEKTLKTLPKSEIRFLKSTSWDGQVFVTTSSPDRTTYFLYQKTEDGFQKIAKSKSPLELDEIVYPREKPKKVGKRAVK